MGTTILLFFEVLYRIGNSDLFFLEGPWHSLYNIKPNLQHSVNGLNGIHHVKLELNKRFHVYFYSSAIVYMYMIMYTTISGEVKIHVPDIVQTWVDSLWVYISAARSNSPTLRLLLQACLNSASLSQNHDTRCRCNQNRLLLSTGCVVLSSDILRDIRWPAGWRPRLASSSYLCS